MMALMALFTAPAFAGLSIGPATTASVLEQADALTHTDQWWPDDYWSADYDDFRFSRRLRRFHHSSAVEVYWSYYDPYYTSDVYYVIGTPYWDRWNYSYNPWRYRQQQNFYVTYDWYSGWGIGSTVYTSGWNPWGYTSYYTYGGYCGSFASYNYYGGYNSWNYNSYNRGWNRGYNRGYQNGYYNGYYNGYNDGYYSGRGLGYQPVSRNNDYWYGRTTRNAQQNGSYARQSSYRNVDRTAIQNSAPRRPDGSPASRTQVDRRPASTYDRTPARTSSTDNRIPDRSNSGYDRAPSRTSSTYSRSSTSQPRTSQPIPSRSSGTYSRPSTSQPAPSRSSGTYSRPSTSQPARASQPAPSRSYAPSPRSSSSSSPRKR